MYIYIYVYVLVIPHFCWVHGEYTKCRCWFRGRSPSVNQSLTLSIFPCTQQKWGITNLYPGVEANYGWIKEKSVLTFVM